MNTSTISQYEDIKNQIKANTEMDAIRAAQNRLNAIKHARGGKYKMSERQFLEEMENMFLAGEFSAAERVMRCVEHDEELNTRDLCIGELHMYVIHVYALLKRRLKLKQNVDLEDLIDGKYSTRKAKDQ